MEVHYPCIFEEFTAPGLGNLTLHVLPVPVNDARCKTFLCITDGVRGDDCDASRPFVSGTMDGN